MKFEREIPAAPVTATNETKTETSQQVADVKVVKKVADVKVVKSVAKKTISCIRGKATKKITGTNPKCPIGWKKK